MSLWSGLGPGLFVYPRRTAILNFPRGFQPTVGEMASILYLWSFVTNTRPDSQPTSVLTAMPWNYTCLGTPLFVRCVFHSMQQNFAC